MSMYCSAFKKKKIADNMVIQLYTWHFLKQCVLQIVP